MERGEKGGRENSYSQERGGRSGGSRVGSAVEMFIDGKKKDPIGQGGTERGARNTACPRSSLCDQGKRNELMLRPPKRGEVKRGNLVLWLDWNRREKMIGEPRIP